MITVFFTNTLTQSMFPPEVLFKNIPQVFIQITEKDQVNSGIGGTAERIVFEYTLTQSTYVRTFLKCSLKI